MQWKNIINQSINVKQASKQTNFQSAAAAHTFCNSTCLLRPGLCLQVRSISCWAFSRYSDWIVEAASEGPPGKEQMDRVLQVATRTFPLLIMTVVDDVHVNSANRIAAFADLSVLLFPLCITCEDFLEFVELDPLDNALMRMSVLIVIQHRDLHSKY
eukprot:scaffold4117_cov28-Prasinocladus_malaysianus.AAC.1